jgi:hypothetical protein
VQPESIEETMEVNEMTQNPEATVEPNESQITISGQPMEETVENASAWLEWLTRE